MPILTQEPDVFPDELLDSDIDPQLNWCVVHTRPRQEKTLGRKLRTLGIGHYIPQSEKKYRSPNGRKRTSFVPLFPGYAFVLCNDEQKLAIYTTNAVAKVLDVVDGEQLLFDLRQVRRLTMTGKALSRMDHMPPGTRVRVKSGPFAEFEGLVLKQRTGDRLLVAVNYLQQGVTIELEDYELEEI
ncbi:MAG: antitermination protein NusG [Planctomycetaceae bacterium]|nr:antitermination protein NusG [Planctomycetaceae bacterium]